MTSRAKGLMGHERVIRSLTVISHVAPASRLLGPITAVGTGVSSSTTPEKQNQPPCGLCPRCSTAWLLLESRITHFIDLHDKVLQLDILYGGIAIKWGEAAAWCWKRILALFNGDATLENHDSSPHLSEASAQRGHVMDELRKRGVRLGGDVCRYRPAGQILLLVQVVNTRKPSPCRA